MHGTRQSLERRLLANVARLPGAERRKTQRRTAPQGLPKPIINRERSALVRAAEGELATRFAVWVAMAIAVALLALWFADQLARTI